MTAPQPDNFLDAIDAITSRAHFNKYCAKHGWARDAPANCLWAMWQHVWRISGQDAAWRRGQAMDDTEGKE